MGLCPSRGCSGSNCPVYNETLGTIHLKRTPLVAGNVGYRIRSFASNEVRDVVGLWDHYKTAVSDRQISWLWRGLTRSVGCVKGWIMRGEGTPVSVTPGLCFLLLEAPGGLSPWFPEPSMQKPSQIYTTEPQLPRMAVFTVVPYEGLMQVTGGIGAHTLLTSFPLGVFLP